MIGIADLNATLAGRYVVECEIGTGGMATVYLARDLRHDRSVAIKVVREGVHLPMGTERFLKEIRTTATLQHPHILPLLDSGEAGGCLFYVMPYVDGETLRGYLDREGALPLPDAIRLAVQIAAALDHAHRRGIVHRDVKPENILLSDGLPIVADFGIALAVAQAGGDRLTVVGASLGTPGYMSPEQVTGEPDADSRSDQYALACLTFEMVAGAPPYRAATPLATMVEHVTRPAPRVTSPHGAVPVALVEALLRALAKEPAARFASVAEFAAALQAALTTVAAPDVEHAPAPVRSIVVLPFENLSPDPEDAYFADGLTEEITADLSKVHALRVISRTSAMRYKATDKDVPTIGRELDVRYVLEGTVRRAGNGLRVTAQLIEAATDAHLWAEKYGGTLDDVFEIQERLAREIVRALEVTLTPEESRRVAGTRIRDPLAYDCYLRARQLMIGGTVETFQAARSLIEEAIARAGETPPLLATAAMRTALAVQTGADADHGNYDVAVEMAERALRLDPDCVEAWITIGIVCKSRGEVLRGAAAFRRALEIEPNHPDALAWLSFMLAEAGRPDEAVALAERMRANNPFDPLTFLWLGLAQLFDGRFEQALETFQTWRRLDPANPWVRIWLVLTNVLLRRDDEARAVLPGSVSWGLPRVNDALETLINRRLDGTSPLLEGIDGDVRALLWNDTETTWMVASALAHVGEREAAVEWLPPCHRAGHVESSLPHHPRHRTRRAARLPAVRRADGGARVALEVICGLRTGAVKSSAHRSSDRRTATAMLRYAWSGPRGRAARPLQDRGQRLGR